MFLLSCFLSCPRKSPIAKLQMTAETRLKKAQHTRTCHMCPTWVSIMPPSPLCASLPTAFYLQTLTSCLLAQNASKSHGGHFAVAIETVIIISNILNASLFPSSTSQQLAIQWEGYAARGGRSRWKSPDSLWSCTWDLASLQLLIISFPSLHRLSFFLFFSLSVLFSVLWSVTSFTFMKGIFLGVRR